MEVFYSDNIDNGLVRLSPEESAHCVKVLRHRAGDEIFVSGGDGNLYRCSLVEADPREAVAQVLSVEGGFGMHPYRLWMAVAPTKNIDRFEWFTEKAVEMGVDRITPLLCAPGRKFIAYCDSDIASGLNTRKSLAEALDAVRSDVSGADGQPQALFLIGPEGDFSSEEIASALAAGFFPLSLGPSRLRTETAAVLCVSALYTVLSCV